MDQLRQRAGVAHRMRKLEGEEQRLQGPSSASPSSIMSGGHINLFEDLERVSSSCAAPSTSLISVPAKQIIPPSRSTKASAPETDKGIALAPSAKDLNPWYSDRSHERNRELEDDRRHGDAILIPVQLPTRDVAEGNRSFPS